MSIGKRGAALRELRAAWNLGAIGELTDGQLLERFAIGEGEPAELAFAALVERHGPMVLRVTRGILADPHDAQDAFQATFLVLVRKARGLWVRDSLGPWLHQVACRVASAARVDAARRRRLERGAAISGEWRAGPVDDLGRILHEEVERLPGRDRAVVVLCDLEGRTHEQAARHLGWPVGTVKSRLSRARQRLRDRLSRRGCAPESRPVAALPPIPPALAAATARAAARFLGTRAIAPGSAAFLAQGVLRTMTMMHWGKAASVALLALGATASGVALLAQDGPTAAKVAPAQTKDGPTAKVEPGKFRLEVRERGVVEASRSFDVINPGEGNTTIISILPEGSMVKQGDLVSELDSAGVRDNLINKRILVQQAEAAYKDARLAREVAEFALKEYLEGVHKQEREAIANEIAAAESGIQKSTARLERTRIALDRIRQRLGTSATAADVAAGLIVEDKLEEAERGLDRDKAGLALAKSRLETLEKFTKTRMVRQFELEVKRARVVELAKQSVWEQQKSEMAKLERQVEACKLRAPADGMVVYANAPRRPDGRPQHQIEEGATVRERQIIFRVVDVGGPMRVNVKVPEAWVDRVALGLMARIKVDSFGDRVMVGKVENVAPMADPNALFEGNRKVYTTRVAIQDGPAGLRPGMTAEAEILILELDNVLTVPIAALVEVDGKYQVAVKRPDGSTDWREVTLGQSNDVVVEVKQGLKPGEAVSLDPGSLMIEEMKRKKVVQPPHTAPFRTHGGLGP